MEPKKDNTQVIQPAPAPALEEGVVMVPIRCGDEIILRPTTNTATEDDMLEYI